MGYNHSLRSIWCFLFLVKPVLQQNACNFHCFSICSLAFNSNLIDTCYMTYCCKLVDISCKPAIILPVERLAVSVSPTMKDGVGIGGDVSRNQFEPWCPFQTTDEDVVCFGDLSRMMPMSGGWWNFDFRSISRCFQWTSIRMVGKPQHSPAGIVVFWSLSCAANSPSVGLVSYQQKQQTAPFLLQGKHWQYNMAKYPKQCSYY